MIQIIFLDIMFPLLQTNGIVLYRNVKIMKYESEWKPENIFKIQCLKIFGIF
jgi:hypothetical protein